MSKKRKGNPAKCPVSFEVPFESCIPSFTIGLCTGRQGSEYSRPEHVLRTNRFRWQCEGGGEGGDCWCLEGGGWEGSGLLSLPPWPVMIVRPDLQKQSAALKYRVMVRFSDGNVH